MEKTNIKNNKYSSNFANKAFVCILIGMLSCSTLTIYPATTTSVFNSIPTTEQKTESSGIFKNNNSFQIEESQNFTNNKLYAPNTGSDEPPIGGITPVSDGYLIILLFLISYCSFKIIRKRRIINS